MKKTRVKKIRVIQTQDPEEFQNTFNRTMEELADQEPEETIQQYKGTHVAYILYTETKQEWDRVSDEFHAEGLRYLCAQCPLHEPAEDGRKKHVWCQYADCGMTHLQHEACELFYKKLKQNEVKPIY